jgi:hypothetical protein
MTPEQRYELIDQLDRSFMVLPTWAKTAVKHSMGAPETNPNTGKPLTSFREVIELASDETLEILREDFEGNGDLLPVGQMMETEKMSGHTYNCLARLYFGDGKCECGEDARIAELEAQLAAAQAEIERMRPVVDFVEKFMDYRGHSWAVDYVEARRIWKKYEATKP